MRVRVRNHVNPLGLAFETFRGRKPVIERGRPVELEIGCADAQFLFERARIDQGRTYIGLEIRSQLIDAVNAMAGDSGLPVQGVFCNANHHLRSILPTASVARVYLNFPDPWFKKRHRKRRMIDTELLCDIHHVLEPDGELFFQSDVWDVALDTLDMLERLDTRYRNRAGSWSFWKRGNPFGVRSWREEHCELEGLPIWRMLYQRLDASEPGESGESGATGAMDAPITR